MNIPTIPHNKADSFLGKIRQELLQVALYLASGLALIGAAISIPRVILNNLWSLLPLVLLVPAAVLALTFLKRLSYTLRSSGLLLMLVVLSLVGLLRPELTFDGRIALVTLIGLATILQGSTIGILTAVLSTVVVIFFSWISSPLPVNEFSPHFTSGHLEWLGTVATFAFSAGIISSSLIFLQKSLSARLDYQEKYADRLKKQNEAFEAQAQEQSKLINQSAAQLSICWSVSHQFQVAEDAGQVLKKIIEIANTNLNFFFSGIFLIDERREYAVLEVATGDVGRTLVESNYRVNLHESGVIALAIQSGEAKIISDTSTSAIFSPTPLLAGTRAQAVIPIKKNNQIIGALDVQSDTNRNFQSDELQTLHWLCDQISQAVEIINLEKEIGNLKTEVNGIYRQMTQQNWRSHLKQTRRTYSYRYRQYALDKNAPQGPEVAQVFEMGETVVSSTDARSTTGQALTTVSIPIKLRNQVLGVLNIKLDTNRLPQDMVPVLEAACNRLAVALENARLLEEIQSKADREHMISEISSKIRNSTNVDQVLRTTAAELGRTFGISEVLVQLRPSDPNLG